MHMFTHNHLSELWLPGPTHIIKHVEIKLKCMLTKWCLHALIAHFSLRKN